MPETFLSAGVLTCLLTVAQHKLPDWLGLAPITPGQAAPPSALLQTALLLLAINLLRALFTGPLAWAVHRWVLLRQDWNDIALPLQRGQRDMVLWVGAVGAAATLPSFANAGLAFLGVADPGIAGGTIAGLGILLFTVLARLAMAGSAIALDIATPLRASWRATRQHGWFIAAGCVLAAAPVVVVFVAGFAAWTMRGNYIGLALFSVALMFLPVVLSAWQASLYALLRGEGAVPDDAPIPVPEPSLVLTVWHSWRAAAAGVAAAPLPIGAACLMMVLSAWVFLHYYTRQHLGLGRTGTLLQDFGWSGLAWIGLIFAQNIILSFYAGAAVMHAVLRHTLRGTRTGLSGLLPTRGLAGITLVMLAGGLVSLVAAVLRVFILVLPSLIGEASAALTGILLLPLILASAVAALRLGLVYAPLALGQRRALAESWRVTRGHVWLIGAVMALAQMPLALAAIALKTRLPPDGLLATLVLPPAALACTVSITGGVCAILYRMLHPGLAEQDRPSRNRAARREPALTEVHLAE